MAQDSVWLHMTTRWRKVKAQGLAGGWWWWRPGREEGTPVPGWSPPRAPGSGLAAPFLGAAVGIFYFSDSLYQSHTGQRIQGRGPAEASPLWQSLGPFLAPGSFLLGCFLPEFSLPEATGLGP